MDKIWKPKTNRLFMDNRHYQNWTENLMKFDYLLFFMLES